MSSKFKPIWKNFLEHKKMPSRFSGILKMTYNELKSLRSEFDQNMSKKIIEQLINGKVLIVKEAFSKKDVSDIKKKIINFWKTQPDSFHKMLEGCPDFHRVISPRIAKNYSVGAVRHTTYFFPWNNDPCNFNEKIYERWRYSKYLAGLSDNEFESNTPKDGSVDRIQIVCYPPGFGGVETHTDTNSNSPLAISCYLSDRKKDFKTGGFYCLDTADKIVDIEPFIEEGDMSLYCPTIEHGVEKIDKNIKDIDINKYDWNSGIGRWWMGLFTNDSNEKLTRKTSTSLAQSF